MEFENRELIDSIGRWIIEDETRPGMRGIHKRN